MIAGLVLGFLMGFYWGFIINELMDERSYTIRGNVIFPKKPTKPPWNGLS